MVEPDPVGHGRFRQVTEALSHRLDAAPAALILALAGALVAIVAATDVATGKEISVSLLYLAPVGLVAWFVAGALAAYATAAVCAVAWLGADRLAGATYSSPLVPYWNATIRLGFFVVVAALASTLRDHLSRERELARTDSLTGVANSRTFAETVHRELARARRYGRPVTVAYVDIDDFKLVNDHLGHLAGDRMLRFIAQHLRSSVRGSDVVGRLGGDEFGILLPEAGPEAGRAAAELIHHRLREALRDALIPVTVSIGAVTFPLPPGSVDEALGRADSLMYQAKGTGKNRAVHEVGGPARSDEPVTGTTEPAREPSRPPARP